MLGKFKETIDKGVATVSVKSNEFIEITKLKTQNTNMEKEIDSLKHQLGAVYFNQWKAGQVDLGTLDEISNEISVKENAIISNLSKIDAMQKENEQILGSQVQNKTITCSCGKINSPNAKFCTGCGSPLESKPDSASVNAAEMKQCSCGNMVRAQAKFCSKCGYRFEVESEAQA